LALVEQIRAETEKQKSEKGNWNGRTNWNTTAAVSRLNQPYEQATNDNSNYYRNTVCWRCNSPGHIARVCQVRIPQQQGTQRGGNRGDYRGANRGRGNGRG
jgi:hypothetical protein